MEESVMNQYLLSPFIDFYEHDKLKKFLFIILYFTH